jgi:hypothetical protein
MVKRITCGSIIFSVVYPIGPQHVQAKCFSSCFYLSPSVQLLENYDSTLPSLLAVHPEPAIVVSASLELIKALQIE